VSFLCLRLFSKSAFALHLISLLLLVVLLLLV
jgi:hypothetical protein